MIIIIPLKARAWAVIPLLLFFFLCGVFIGVPATVLFTAPKLSETSDLWGILAALIAGLLLFVIRQNKDWVVFVMGLLSVTGGLWVGTCFAKEDLLARQSPHLLARSPAPLPAQSSHPAAAGASEQPLRIRSIFYLGLTNSSAVINGRTVSVGEKVGGWHVKAIGPKNVVLEDPNGKTNVLFLK